MIQYRGDNLIFAICEIELIKNNYIPENIIALFLFQHLKSLFDIQDIKIRYSILTNYYNFSAQNKNRRK